MADFKEKRVRRVIYKGWVDGLPAVGAFIAGVSVGDLRNCASEIIRSSSPDNLLDLALHFNLSLQLDASI